MRMLSNWTVRGIAFGSTALATALNADTCTTCVSGPISLVIAVPEGAAAELPLLLGMLAMLAIWRKRSLRSSLR